MPLGAHLVAYFLALSQQRRVQWETAALAAAGVATGGQLQQAGGESEVTPTSK